AAAADGEELVGMTGADALDRQRPGSGEPIIQPVIQCRNGNQLLTGRVRSRCGHREASLLRNFSTLRRTSSLANVSDSVASANGRIMFAALSRCRFIARLVSRSACAG